MENQGEVVSPQGWYVYILKSAKSGRFYVGYTNDPEARLAKHNDGAVTGSRYSRPWVLVYTERYDDAREARQKEYHLKAQKSPKFLEALVEMGG